MYIHIVTLFPWVYVYYEDGIYGTQGFGKSCPVERIAARNEYKSSDTFLGGRLDVWGEGGGGLMWFLAEKGVAPSAGTLSMFPGPEESALVLSMGRMISSKSM